MENNKNFNIKIPNFTSNSSNKSQSTEQKNNIEELKSLIKSQYEELIAFQDLIITKDNIKDLEKFVFATEDLINNCMNDSLYSGNRDQYFVNLIFICHKISLNIETFKTEQKIAELDRKNNIISNNQKKLEKKQINAEEQSNNLIYNILGFIASFSVVSAAVVAIEKINSMSGTLLFMCCCIFLLLTTLIGLNNFYKANNEPKKKLQDNYFLWKMMIGVILLVVVYRGVEYIKENQQQIFESIGRGIEQVRQDSEKYDEKNQN